MVSSNIRFVAFIGAILLAGAIQLTDCQLVRAQQSSKLNIEGKVVLANVDRYPVSFRIGTVQKKILSKKATLLSPKRFPVTVQIWNGVRGRAAWESKSISEPGIYTCRFQNGRWTFSRHQPRPATSPSRSKVTTRPTYRRTTGTVPRVVRGSGRVYYGGRLPLLRRVAGDVLSLYRFVRDEEDRDLIRDIIIGREIDREIEQEILDRLDDMAVNLPAYDRREFERALEDLEGLSDKDLRDLEAATDDEWGQVRDALGDEVTDNAWREVESDFGDIEVDDLSEQDLDDLGEAGIDSLDSDIDIGDLDGGDIDIGNLGGTFDDIDIGDLGGGIEDIDLGDIGGGFGGDFGGDLGGGFDYDAGGFDDFGGGFDDFGGGFDDFGGGFDDFGGGFDDF